MTLSYFFKRNRMPEHKREEFLRKNRRDGQKQEGLPADRKQDAPVKKSGATP